MKVHVKREAVAIDVNTEPGEILASRQVACFNRQQQAGAEGVMNAAAERRAATVRDAADEPHHLHVTLAHLLRVRRSAAAREHECDDKFDESHPASLIAIEDMHS